MAEPKAVTYKHVQKAIGEGSMDAWRRIGEITGAGYVPLDADGDAVIDITELSEAKQSQIDALMNKGGGSKSKKEGNQ